jgi:hypothetical protein
MSSLSIRHPDTALVIEVERIASRAADSPLELHKQIAEVARLTVAVMAYCQSLEHALEALAKSPTR